MRKFGFPLVDSLPETPELYTFSELKVNRKSNYNFYKEDKKKYLTMERAIRRKDKRRK